MSGPSHVSLSEALTLLAFNDPVTADRLGAAISSERWGVDRDSAYETLAGTANVFCDLGFAGELECWGRRSSDPSDSCGVDGGDYFKLTQADFLGYRQFVIGHDALWKVKGDVDPDEFSITFSAFASASCIRSIRVDRNALGRSPGAKANVAKFTDVERAEWIQNCSERNGDDAYRHFKADPRWDGTTQSQFRVERGRCLGISGRGRRKW